MTNRVIPRFSIPPLLRSAALYGAAAFVTFAVMVHFWPADRADRAAQTAMTRLNVPAATADLGWHGEQRDMIRQILAKLTRQRDRVRDLPLLSPRVLQTLQTVPRYLFVAEEWHGQTYLSHRALPIGPGRQMMAPYLSALIAELASVDKQDNVLEVGTGSGYLTAILGRLAGKVTSTELEPKLAREARQRLQRLDLPNVSVELADGILGLASDELYDVIIIKEAMRTLPRVLIEKLAPEGRIIMALENAFGEQRLGLVRCAGTAVCSFDGFVPVYFSKAPPGSRI